MKKDKIFFLILLILSIIYSTFILIDYHLSLKPKFTIPLNTTVSRVIDGDTIELGSGEKIRLICINTPEKNELGYENATEFLKSLVLNKQVRLETDKTDKDKYKRLLRYIYVIQDNKEIFVNKEIVQKGYGVIYRYDIDIKKCDEIEFG